jgi:glutamate-ammonia-ligase adenylyltransferase
MLAVSLDGFADYQRKEAWTWEHMALCRSRPVRGSAQGRARLQAAVDSVLTAKHDPERVRLDAAKMRSEMARHKPPSGPLDIKLGAGGLVDLEFSIHTLQLSNGVGFDPRLEHAIAALAQAGLIDLGCRGDLALLLRMLVVLRLVTPTGAEPPSQSRQLIAEQCGYPDWEALLDAHAAARQRVSQLWSKVRDRR